MPSQNEIERLTAERDKAREDCGFQKGLKESIHSELNTFIRLRTEALATVAERDVTIDQLKVSIFELAADLAARDEILARVVDAIDRARPDGGTS